MPKIVDYAGRFAFFELASFTLVRDHGVDHLSRHALARVLATSTSTVRRLLDSEADLRVLALREVAQRRRRRLVPATSETGVDAGVRLLLPWLPAHLGAIAEELVWWRLSIAAASTAPIPSDAAFDPEHDLDEDEVGSGTRSSPTGSPSSYARPLRTSRPRRCATTPRSCMRWWTGWASLCPWVGFDRTQRPCWRETTSRASLGWRSAEPHQRDVRRRGGATGVVGRGQHR